MPQSLDVVFLALAFVVPALCGMRRIRLGCLPGFHPLHEQPTAWDYIFHAIDTPLFALVTFKDGSTVGGLVANGTFASSQSRERDLYLERVYNVAADGTWQETPSSAGILVRGDEIRHIEFWSNWVDGES